MAKRKRLKKGNWTNNEIKKLKKLFPNMSCSEAAAELGRPLFAVKRKAYRLGIYKSKRYLKSIGRR